MTKLMDTNIVPHNFHISVDDRRKLNGHNSLLLWFTGLSGSGKSTIANELENQLFKKGIKTYILDGDNVRGGINKDLTFDPEDRTENIRRIAEISNLMIDAGLVILATFVSPYKKDREAIKYIVKANFIEIFISTPLEECEKRDTKGLYKKARYGKINNMTGISAPYEAPEKADLEINTTNETVESAVKTITNYILPKLKLDK